MRHAAQFTLARQIGKREPKILQEILIDELSSFQEFNKRTRLEFMSLPRGEIPTFTNEFWTSKQRAANALHEISYRACFKAQLPRFFIERLTRPGDVVYDPFMGRGTTPIESAILGRIPFGNDVNPLSLPLTRPRLRPPKLDEIIKRLGEIDLTEYDEFPEDLLVFYHPDTLREICALKKYFLTARRGQHQAASCGSDAAGLDQVDDWLRMVSLNRLTGHSPGFFSVYTLPPNQAVSVESQRRINEQRQQTPPRRHVAQLILKKSKQLLADMTPVLRQRLARVADRALLINAPAEQTDRIPDESVDLVVTSPPFLDVVDYATDNWLRCWFLGIDPQCVKLTVTKKLDAWAAAMTRVFAELHRVLKAGGHIAFEVGEVHSGRTKLEETVVPCAVAAGFDPVLILINDQKFTKTANCWGVRNNMLGTNTNRVVLLRKPNSQPEQLLLPPSHLLSIR